MQNNYINNVFKEFNTILQAINNISDLNNLNSLYLGKNGKINLIFKEINNIKSLNKKKIFNKLNLIKHNILELITVKKIELTFNEKKKYIDITIPLNKYMIGSKHILNKTITELKCFFLNNDFDIVNGIEIDNVYNNFDALNMPIDHPARNINDTFYLNNNMLLRTHTSNMQSHIMKKKFPPMKIFSCGKVYRRDYDVSHTPMFNQMEVFKIDINISLKDLKNIILDFLNCFFNKKVVLKFRSSFFSFTEPSFEVDIKCIYCGGRGCNVCKKSGWIEILGCGMIHPNVLKINNIDPSIYNGFAFGIGIERLTMIKYKINDIKLFYENNVSFLNQF